MRTTPTIAMLVLAALLVGLAAVVSAPDRRATSTPGQRLLSEVLPVPIDEVDRIEVRRPGEHPIVLQRDGGAWWQVEPFPHPMSALQVVRFSEVLHEVRIVDEFTTGDSTGGADLSVMGLDPPEASLSWRWPEGESSIDLGRRGVAGRAYARIPGWPTVLVVEQGLHRHVLETDPTGWRDPRLFPDAALVSRSIERHVLGKVLRLERVQGRWTMVEPVRTRVDPVELGRFVAELARAACTEYILDVPADPAAFGLERPAVMLEVEASDPGDLPGASTVLRIGGRLGATTQDRYGMVEGRPTVFRLSERTLRPLLVSPPVLADPTASGVIAADVKSIHIDADGTSLLLARDLERWTAPEHDRREIDSDTVEHLLHVLTTRRAPEVRFEPWPASRAVARITLHGWDGRPMDTVRIAREPGEDGAWLLENGDDVLRVFYIDLDLPLTPGAYGLPARARR